MRKFLDKWLIRFFAFILLIAIHSIALKSFSATSEIAKPFCELKSVIMNSDSIRSIGEKIEALVASEQCVVQAVPCDVKTESFPGRALAKYQIAIADIAKFGASTTQQLFEAIGRLKDVGICQEGEEGP